MLLVFIPEETETRTMKKTDSKNLEKAIVYIYN